MISHQAIGYSADKLRLIHNGMDLQAFGPDPFARQSLRQEWNCTDDVIVIGTVGRYHPIKGYPTFIRAAAQLIHRQNNFVFVMCGKGLDEQNEELCALLKAEGVEKRFRLLGSRADVARVYSAFDVFVLSSEGEGFPNVLGEALATGLPCVSTAVGDAREIIKDFGAVVAVGSATELADATTRFARLAADARHDLADRSRKYICDTYDIEAVYLRYTQTWCEAARM